MNDGEPIRIEAAPADRGQRVDRFLATRLDMPRNRIQGWIRDRLVAVNGVPVRASLILGGGEVIECRPLPPSGDDDVRPEEGPLAVVYEDAFIVVVDKPARMAVHPGAGRPDGTLVNRLVARYPEMGGVGGRGRPGIVHRLDIDTTGLVLLARTDEAYRRLSGDFASRRISKTYLAICYGSPSPSSGELSQPIGRHPHRRKEMTVRSDGRPALTIYDRLASASGASLVRVGLETGRTHQIRVHFKAAGYPLVGDPVYGEARWKGVDGRGRTALRSFSRPALHAWKLSFQHPIGGETLDLIAPPPEDFVGLWRALAQTELGDVLGSDR